jgi:hypothetical protein
MLKRIIVQMYYIHFTTNKYYNSIYNLQHTHIHTYIYIYIYIYIYTHT